MSSVLFIPRKSKRLRVHKVIPKGYRPKRRIPQGSVASIFATTFGYLNWRHIESGRRFLTRQLKRAKVKVKIRLTQPVTAKAKQSRMGKGKGKFKGWIGFIRPGTPMYEMGTTARQTWQEHKNPHTRATGKFPFENIKHKFPYGVEVRRRKIIGRKKNFFRLKNSYGVFDTTRTHLRKRYKFTNYKTLNPFLGLIWDSLVRYKYKIKLWNKNNSIPTMTSRLYNASLDELPKNNIFSMISSLQKGFGVGLVLMDSFSFNRRVFMEFVGQQYELMFRTKKFKELNRLQRLYLVKRHMKNIIKCALHEYKYTRYFSRRFYSQKNQWQFKTFSKAETSRLFNWYKRNIQQKDDDRTKSYFWLETGDKSRRLLCYYSKTKTIIDCNSSHNDDVKINKKEEKIGKVKNSNYQSYEKKPEAKFSAVWVADKELARLRNKKIKKKVQTWLSQRFLDHWNLQLVTPVKTSYSFGSQILAVKTPQKQIFNVAWLIFFLKILDCHFKQMTQIQKKSEHKWKLFTTRWKRRKRIKKNFRSFWWHRKNFRVFWIKKSKIVDRVTDDSKKITYNIFKK